MLSMRTELATLLWCAVMGADGFEAVAMHLNATSFYTTLHAPNMGRWMAERPPRGV